MIESIFYSLGCAVAVLLIFHLLQVILSGVGEKSPAPAMGKPSNDVCWYCHRVMGNNRVTAKLPFGGHANICPKCASDPGIAKSVVGG